MGPTCCALPHLIRAWKPGARAAVVEVPANNNEKIPRRVRSNDAFDVTSHLAATDLANDVRNNRIDGTLHDNEIFGKEGHGKRRALVVIAAEPDTSHHPPALRRRTGRSSRPAGTSSPSAPTPTLSRRPRSPSASSRPCSPSAPSDGSVR